MDELNKAAFDCYSRMVQLQKDINELREQIELSRRPAPVPTLVEAVKAYIESGKDLRDGTDYADRNQRLAAMRQALAREKWRQVTATSKDLYLNRLFALVRNMNELASLRSENAVLLQERDDAREGCIDLSWELLISERENAAFKARIEELEQGVWKRMLESVRRKYGEVK